MAWQRTIPFGYEMRNGEIIINPMEATVVQAIFSTYLHGKSYQAIAAEMERQGISYHKHTSRWNKNMVKRILENPRYTGSETYPQLITASTFAAVQLRKKDINTYAPCLEEIKVIRPKMKCGRCGAKILRKTATNGYQYWQCKNSECVKSFRLADSAIVEQVGTLLCTLTNFPDRIAHRPKPGSSPDLPRIRNELTRALNQADTNISYMKALAMAEAAEKYKQIPDPTPAWELDKLRERLAAHPAGEDDLRMLFALAVNAVLISPDGQVTLKLVSGEIFDGEVE